MTDIGAIVSSAGMSDVHIETAGQGTAPPVVPGIAGQLSATLGAMTCVAVGTLAIVGQMSVTLAAMTCSATATQGQGIHGQVDATLDAMTCNATSTLRINGQVNATLDAMTCDATVTQSSSIHGQLNATLASMTCVSTGTLSIVGQLNVTLANISVPSAETQVITREDITYLGAFDFPFSSPHPLYDSRAAMTLRRVGGTLTFIVSGVHQKVNGWEQSVFSMASEWTYPGEDLTTPPEATLVRTWEDLWEGKGHGCADTVGRPDNHNATITSISVGNPTIVTHTLPVFPFSGYPDGVYVSGSNSTPSIDGSWNATILSSTSFSLPTAVTVVGTTGSIQQGGDGSPILFGLYLEPGTNHLWWGYSTQYEGNSHNPSIGMSVINDDGTATAYGPWRTTMHSGYCNGTMNPIPESFLSYVPGRTHYMGNPAHAQNSTAAWGSDILAFAFPDPFTTPKDVINDNHTTIDTKPLLWFPITHPQPRLSANFKLTSFVCSQDPQPHPGCSGYYDSALGGIMGDPPLVFGGGGGGLLDTVDTSVWIDVPGGKRGIIEFGELVDSIPGMTYTDGGTIAHNWYGPQTDAFGQTDSINLGLGPHTGSLVSSGWIFDPNDLIPVAQNTADPWSPLSTQEFQLNTIPGASGLNVLTAQKSWGQAVFDPVTSKIFIPQLNARAEQYNVWPRVHVFHVDTTNG